MTNHQILFIIVTK